MRRDNLVFFGMLLGAPLVVLALLLVVLHEPQSALIRIAQIFLFSEVLSLVLGFLVYGLIARLRRGSIFLKLALGYALALGVIAVNVVLVSMSMFIAEQDVRLLFILLIFAGLLGLAFGGWLARSITHALARLTESAEELARGNLHARARVASGDEVERLAGAFNEMAARLEESFSRQNELEQARRELVAAASHDLRTPLASLRAMMEALTDGVVTDPATVERYLRSAQGQVQTLTLLVNDLFELAQQDSGAAQWPVEPASLRDLISDTLESMQAQAEAQGVTLGGAVDPAVDPVLMNSHRIQRVLDNLLQNALRHTPAGGSVRVDARSCDGKVEVSVTDTGQGIPESDLPHLFDRFYRGDRSRSRETGGAGLGLAIARGIVETHGGRIGVESQFGKGTRVYFTLPQARKAF